MTRLAEEGMDRDAVVARNDRILGLLDHAGWTYIVERLQARKESVEREILGGELSIEDYHRYAGELKGIVFALETPRNLIRQAPEGGPDATA